MQENVFKIYLCLHNTQKKPTETEPHCLKRWNLHLVFKWFSNTTTGRTTHLSVEFFKFHFFADFTVLWDGGSLRVFWCACQYASLCVHLTYDLSQIYTSALCNDNIGYMYNVICISIASRILWIEKIFHEGHTNV